MYSREHKERKERKERQEKIRRSEVDSQIGTDGPLSARQSALYRNVLGNIHSVVSRHLPRKLVNLVCGYYLNLNNCSIEIIKQLASCADQNHPLVIDAQARLGRAYYFGKGIAKDNAEGIKWLRLARARLDLPAGQWALGLCYCWFIDIDRCDTAIGISCYEKAAEQGYAPAQSTLAFYYMYHSVTGNKGPEKAVMLYSLAAAQGYAEAQTHLGCCYAFGRVVPKNRKKALELYRLAAAQNYPEAQASLGYCYEHGKGVVKDKQEAIKWYRLAAKQGHQVSQRALESLGVSAIDSAAESEKTKCCFISLLCRPGFNNSLTLSNSTVSSTSSSAVFSGFTAASSAGPLFSFSAGTKTKKKGKKSKKTSLFGFSANFGAQFSSSSTSIPSATSSSSAFDFPFGSSAHLMSSFSGASASFVTPSSPVSSTMSSNSSSAHSTTSVSKIRKVIKVRRRGKGRKAQQTSFFNSSGSSASFSFSSLSSVVTCPVASVSDASVGFLTSHFSNSFETERIQKELQEKICQTEANSQINVGRPLSDYKLTFYADYIKNIRDLVRVYLPMDLANLVLSYGRDVNVINDFHMLHQLAKKNYPEAQARLGYLYYSGTNTEENIIEGSEWLRVTEKNSSAGLWVQGFFRYREGVNLGSRHLGYSQQYAYSSDCLRRKQTNFIEAVGLFKRAASQGNVLAYFYLGLCYDSGRGVAKDDRMAVQYYKFAVEQGLPEAYNCLAYRYRHGKGVTQDIQTAFRLYLVAAQNGDVQAQVNVGELYEKGVGVDKNITEAVRWLRIAARREGNYAEYARDILTRRLGVSVTESSGPLFTR